GEFSPVAAGPGTHVLTYTFSTDYCTDSARSEIVVHALPVQQPFLTVGICGETPVQLGVSGGSVYQWSPASGLSDPASRNPIATVDSTTTFVTQVTDDNGCSVQDTTV